MLDLVTRPGFKPLFSQAMPPPWRHAWWFVLTFIAYAGAVVLTKTLRVAEGQVTPLWIPLGLMAGIYLAERQRRYWPAMAAGGLLAQVLIWEHPVAAPWLSGVLGIENQITAALVALVVRWIAGSPPGFTLRASGALFVGSLVGIVCLAAPITGVLFQAGFKGSFWGLFLQNCASGPLSTLVITPPVVSLLLYGGHLKSLPLRRLGEGAALVVLTALAGYLAFWVNDALAHHAVYMLLPVPLMLWAVLRFDVAFAAGAVLLVESIAFLASRDGMGPLRGVPPETRTFILQINFLAVAIAIVFTAAIITDRRLALRALEGQLRFEQTLAKVSSLLVRVQPDTVDELLSGALAQVAGLLDCNRVVLGTADPGTSELIARAGFRTTEPAFPHRFVISELYPDLWKRLLGGHAVCIADTQGLPDSAEQDRARYAQVGIHSQLAVPVRVDGVLRFILAASNIGEGRDWTSEESSRLQVLAEVFASAVMRSDAQAAVQRNERLFRAFVENAPVPIMIAPWVDGSPLYFNPAFTRLFGYTRDEIREPGDWWPRAYPDLAQRAERRATWELHKHAAQGGAYMDGSETLMQGKDGSARYAQVRLSEIDGFRLIFFNDLTARRNAEQAAEQHLVRLASLAAELTRAEERQRREIAAVLHDDVGQNLFAATTQLIALKGHHPALGGAIDRVLELLGQVGKHTRELTYELCPPVLYEIGLKAAIQRLADQFSQQYGITCAVAGDSIGPSDLNARGLAYHAVRELLANVARHSGASAVEITLSEGGEQVLINVFDNGRGFDAEANNIEETSGRRSGKELGRRGFGLFHLKERLDLLGGSLTIKTAIGEGCRVQVRLPQSTPSREFAL